MIGAVIKKLFGTHHERTMKKIWPRVEEINQYYESMHDLSDEEIQAKTAEFRLRLQDGATLDELLPEAYAVVKQACKRNVGQNWMAAGNPVEWVEVPYDVQLFGAIVLHEGKIAEMRTGEGKTLVAVLPLYLNALEGRGCHLVTTNDFLALRDSEWTGHILQWLGLTVGCLQQNMDPPERRKQYACDVTYGQNSEFGFDYLRDNMTGSANALVQGPRSLLAQEVAEEIIATAKADESGQVVADGFQTLIVEIPLNRVAPILEEYSDRFGIEELRIYWRGEKRETEIPALPSRAPELHEHFGVDEVAEGMARVRFEFLKRDHHYAIVDEVDSILIDEARTPLIISGQVDRSTQQYDRMRAPVQKLVREQANLVQKLLKEAEELLEAGDPDSRYKGGIKLLQVKKASPKNKRFMKYYSEPDISRLVDRCENDFMIDQKSKLGEKSMRYVEEELYFVIDEKGHSVDLTENGREAISPEDPDQFLIVDIVDEFSAIEGDDSLSEEDKEKRKAEVRQRNEIRSEELHNLSQLLRAYTLFEKDVEYVVQDNKVVIVDEFTGRLQPGRRYSDGLHQAIEAKEGVKIEKETQTLATITIQNYFRMYDKLSGMTGTAETEAAEFGHTYKMDVVVIPTHRPICREDEDDVIYRTRREKYNAVIEEIIRLSELRLPVLVGTVSVEVSELLSRMLRRTGISHSVLNAKHHQKEAEIIRDAGQPGAVTIATNMAGRGIDIKLGEGVIRKDENGELDPEEPGGLQVIGTERHDARRIDNQLRGRSGRQGDPGRTRFYLSLEDDLMRLFGSDRISGIMQRLGLEDGEEIHHPFITRAITKAQKKIEEINFERRKRTLDYDNVMNKQRESIYGLRREVLVSEDLKDVLFDLCFDYLGAKIEDFQTQNRESDAPPYDLVAFHGYLASMIPGIKLDDLTDYDEPDEAYMETLMERIRESYEARRDAFGPDITLQLSRAVILQAIDEQWRDHLHGVDELREGIHLRAYAQLDPLIEYQRDATHMFQSMMTDVQKIVFEHFFRVNLVREPAQTRTASVDYGRGAMEDVQQPSPDQAPAGVGGGQQPEPRKPRTFVRDQPKVGRNDPCPCGSGKKYKKCCGQNG
ncbi:MAG: preprotein translocase subunit SecA [Candidatus Sumerlaeia bacterium]